MIRQRRGHDLPLLLLLLLLVLLLAPTALAFRPLSLRMSSTADRQTLPLLFPPSVRPTTLVFQDPAHKLWTFEQPFITTTNINTRMSVFKAGPAAIVVYSPIACTPECVEMVHQAAGGMPTHILMQSNAVDHTLFLDGWRKAVPTAQILAVNPATNRGDLPLLDADKRHVVPLPFQSATSPVVEAALLDISPFFREVVLYHKPSKSVLCADAIWRVVSPRFSPNVIAQGGWLGFGVLGLSKFPYWFYLPRRKREEVQRFVAQVQGWGEVRRVLPGHLDPIPSAGVDEEAAKEPGWAKRVFLQSFDFILQ